MCKDQESIQSIPHLTKDTYGKVTNSQLDTTNESQEVSPFPAGNHKAQIKGITHTRHKKNIKDPQKKNRLGMVSKICNRFHGANLTLNSDVDRET